MAEDDAHTTLSLLETRLRRLEFSLNSNPDLEVEHDSVAKPSQHETVAERLAKLEDDLRRLTSKSSPVQNVLRLSSRYPELFQQQSENSPFKLTEMSTLASIVLAHASIFPETASRLSSLKTLPIPDASVSAQLVDLQPRIETALQMQREQEVEVADLRSRSAKVVEWWVNVGVVGMGECWAGWETRVRECGRNVAATEASQFREAA